MLSKRNAHRISLIAGLLILAIAGLSRMAPSVPVCGDLPASYDPIIAFEMARSVDDLHALFGPAPSECRTAITAQMNLINIIDCAIYIAIYGSFLAFFMLSFKAERRRTAVVATSIVATSCIADYIENLCLFKLADNPDEPSIWLTLLTWFTETKWIGLGAAGVFGGYLLMKRDVRWQLALIPCSLGLIASLISIANPAMIGPYLSLAFLFGWLVFLVVDARESLRR